MCMMNAHYTKKVPSVVYVVRKHIANPDGTISIVSPYTNDPSPMYKMRKAKPDKKGSFVTSFRNRSIVEAGAFHSFRYLKDAIAECNDWLDSPFGVYKVHEARVGGRVAAGDFDLVTCNPPDGYPPQLVPGYASEKLKLMRAVCAKEDI